jgi:hypothetical protein
LAKVTSKVGQNAEVVVNVLEDVLEELVGRDPRRQPKSV